MPSETRQSGEPMVSDNRSAACKVIPVSKPDDLACVSSTRATAASYKDPVQVKADPDASADARVCLRSRIFLSAFAVGSCGMICACLQQTPWMGSVKGSAGLQADQGNSLPVAAPGPISRVSDRRWMCSSQ